MASYAADSEAPIIMLLAKKHFEQLPSRNAQLYAHHLSRASHWGTRAVLRSVSPESEAIYDLILAVHQALDSPPSAEEYQLRLAARARPAHVFDERAVALYLEYASQFLSNLGNFKSFGDQKFVPQVARDQFAAIVAAAGGAPLADVFALVVDAVYSTDCALLGWPEKGQTSSYYPDCSATITREEVEAINGALAARGIMPENTRVSKKSASHFVVLVASAVADNTTDYYPRDPITLASGASVDIQFGDHAAEFAHITRHMRLAHAVAANDTQRNMLDAYAESFETGSMNAHKQSQIHWVKDLGPLVESNIGFIETYRDPSGVRGEWEGLVAMVNQDRTAKFATLVNSASDLIPHLPWSTLYEKDTFTPPDFTSLEVLTFAGSGCPAGINIPNYDDVRLNVGFKNVSLGNVLSANPKKPKKEEVISFIHESLQAKFRKWRDDAFEVQVGLHELLGHGTGKLLQETTAGVFNFDKAAHPEITTFYKPNETWGSLFSASAGSFEECRAELVALFLILAKPDDVLPIFGISDAESKQDVKLIATILMARAGVVGLEFWDPESKKWGQAHMQARFGIFKALYRAGVVSFKHSKDNFDDLELVTDESKLDTDAVEALRDFLHKLHVYKTTANVEEGLAFYGDMTDVTEEFAQYRDVVLRKKLPRKQLIQANTFLNADGTVEVREYEESEVGMIQSFVDRAV
ncbi:dipeptidyl-peptidase III [Metschnikowia bicuspidata var. bicuspidata NRRL YB-4993]|uniref:Dipeptidyl peptidase 3 n=1 Tax=Metschnikowia bicuspidata var. bicuspidata NRRL YB-4993 TaxID=869754 RepID=A0A1A0HF29_9ASCO|nr:dipeptidyl-peptidase III [Metschnikowia bicuspidata var. bicuspidata NRRL YB-4993]OBA22493.1 dipeptidyl-peptidase III [Metschnikowia bicuspidata var. bicuspidata NRRL YB-4993]